MTLEQLKIKDNSIIHLVLQLNWKF
jgi:hypothetical protein